MSTEFGPTSQRYDDEGRSEPTPPMPETPPAYDTLPAMPQQPDYTPAFAGHFNAPIPDNERSWLNKIGRTRAMIASAVAGSVLTGVIVGVGVSGKSEGNEAPRLGIGNSAPEYTEPPTETIQPSPTTSHEIIQTQSEYYPTLYDSPQYKELTPDQQHEVNKLEEMSLDEFSRLSYDRRLAYADFYYSVYKDYGREIVSNYDTYQKDTPDFTDAGSSGQGILNDLSMKTGVLYASLATDGNLDAINERNRPEAMKALALVYNLQAAESQSYLNRIEELKGLTSLHPDDINDLNGTGYMFQPVDRESIAAESFGTISKRVNVRLRSGGTNQYWLSYNDSYNTIQGNEKFGWQLRMILQEGHPLYIPDVENAYIDKD